MTVLNPRFSQFLWNTPSRTEVVHRLSRSSSVFARQAIWARRARTALLAMPEPVEVFISVSARSASAMDMPISATRLAIKTLRKKQSLEKIKKKKKKNASRLWHKFSYAEIKLFSDEKAAAHSFAYKFVNS